LITAKQLKAKGIGTYDGIEFIFKDGDYSFNIFTQELWFINDGYGEPDLVAKVTNINELMNIIELLS